MKCHKKQIQLKKNKLEKLINVLQVFTQQIQDAIHSKLAFGKKQPDNQQFMANKFGDATTGQGNQQIAVVSQRGPQSSTPITRREFLRASLGQLFTRGSRRLL